MTPSPTDSALLGCGTPRPFVPIPPHLNPLPRRGEEISTAPFPPQPRRGEEDHLPLPLNQDGERRSPPSLPPLPPSPVKQPTHISHYARCWMTPSPTDSALLGCGTPRPFVPIPPHLNPLPRRGEEISTASFAPQPRRGEEISTFPSPSPTITSQTTNAYFTLRTLLDHAIAN